MGDSGGTQYSDVVTQILTFTNPAQGFSDEQTAALTTSITTNVTEFLLTVTQYNPYDGAPTVVQTQVTITPAGRGNDGAGGGGGAQSTSPPAGQSSTPSAAVTTPPTSASGGGASNSALPASSTTSAAPDPTPNPSGISSGAAAGIGIGCAAAGALLAALIVLLCMRRRRRSNSSGHATRSLSRGPSMRGNAYPHGGGGVPMGGVSKAGGATPTVTVEKALEPPMQDSAVHGLLQRLGTAVKDHAQSYYVARGGAGGAAAGAERVAAVLGAGAPVRAEEVAGMLASAPGRVAGVRFLIAWGILRNVSGAPETSLLPPELAESLEVMHAGRAKGGGESRDGVPRPP